MTIVIGVEIIPQPLLDVSQDVQIQLFTLKNPIEPQILVINDTNSIIESNYNIKLPTRIFIHGFYSKGELKETLTEGKNKYLQKTMELIELLNCFYDFSIFNNWQERCKLDPNQLGKSVHYIQLPWCTWKC